MRFAWFVLVLLCLSPFVFAAGTSWFSSGLVKMQLDVSSSLELEGDVRKVSARVFFVPQESQFLAVREIKTSPPAVVSSRSVHFEFSKLRSSLVPFSYSAVVDVANDAPRVRAKIPFPLSIGSFGEFKESSKNIDSNHPAVIARAREISSGEDDLFVVVSKIGMWVKTNVDYNLSTLTADVSQPASWVLENRYGVCDEMTSLFIAMVRSLGVPARFVSGVAYTEENSFAGTWGPHGWAEVYFPGVGWVPFDPTFGEFAWVDPSHIKLKESVDPSEPATSVEWLGGRVRTNPLNMRVKKLSDEGFVPNEVSMNLRLIGDRVGFGSFNGVVLEVENFADYYVAKEFMLSPVEELEVFGGLARQVILPPKSRAAVGWKVRLKDDLRSGQYVVPVVVSTIRNDSVSSSFVAGQFEVPLPQSSVDAALNAALVKRPAVFEVACALREDVISVDKGAVDCSIMSRGQKGVARVCFEECVDVEVVQNVPSNVSFVVNAHSPGVYPVDVVATLGDYFSKAQLSIVRLDDPRLVISEVSAPSSIGLNEVLDIRFMVRRSSIAVPRNVEVVVEGGGAISRLSFGDLQIDQEVIVSVDTNQLFSSTPKFDIVAVFEDERGVKFEAKSQVSTVVEGVPWYKRMVGFIIGLLP